jgi:hypothetical protein
MMGALLYLPYEVVSKLATLSGVALIAIAVIPSPLDSKLYLALAVILVIAGGYFSLSTLAHLLK